MPATTAEQSIANKSYNVTVLRDLGIRFRATYSSPREVTRHYARGARGEPEAHVG